MSEQSADLPFATPVRRKPLAVRRAESKARRAQARGARLEAARVEGPAAVAAVQFDWARSAFARLDGLDAARAWEDLVDAIARIREQHAQ